MTRGGTGNKKSAKQRSPKRNSRGGQRASKAKKISTKRGSISSKKKVSAKKDKELEKLVERTITEAEKAGLLPLNPSNQELFSPKPPPSHLIHFEDDSRKGKNKKKTPKNKTDQNLKGGMDWCEYFVGFMLVGLLMYWSGYGDEAIKYVNEKFGSLSYLWGGKQEVPPGTAGAAGTAGTATSTAAGAAPAGTKAGETQSWGSYLYSYLPSLIRGSSTNSSSGTAATAAAETAAAGTAAAEATKAAGTAVAGTAAAEAAAAEAAKVAEAAAAEATKVAAAEAAKAAAAKAAEAAAAEAAKLAAAEAEKLAKAAAAGASQAAADQAAKMAAVRAAEAAKASETSIQAQANADRTTKNAQERAAEANQFAKTVYNAGKNKAIGLFQAMTDYFLGSNIIKKESSNNIGGGTKYQTYRIVKGKEQSVREYIKCLPIINWFCPCKSQKRYVMDRSPSPSPSPYYRGERRSSRRKSQSRHYRY